MNPQAIIAITGGAVAYLLYSKSNSGDADTGASTKKGETPPPPPPVVPPPSGGDAPPPPVVPPIAPKPPNTPSGGDAPPPPPPSTGNSDVTIDETTRLAYQNGFIWGRSLVDSGFTTCSSSDAWSRYSADPNWILFVPAALHLVGDAWEKWKDACKRGFYAGFDSCGFGEYPLDPTNVYDVVEALWIRAFAFATAFREEGILTRDDRAGIRNSLDSIKRGYTTPQKYDLSRFSGDFGYAIAEILYGVSDYTRGMFAKGQRENVTDEGIAEFAAKNNIVATNLSLWQTIQQNMEAEGMTFGWNKTKRVDI